MNRNFATLLIEWFEENKREMPWRKTSDPYCIWVSEVMLQQTQVATVIPYYIRFMERFPTVTDLAEATLEDVHQYWQGLGYYRRGENLWKGAKVIQERWNGEFPKDPKLISEIPGIGPYTLGAICSIAFHLPLPAVDGNVMRVMSRWYCISDDIGIAKNRKIFEQKVMENMPNNPNAFNQGLMELGALICTPKNPKCEECPVKLLCQAYQTGAVSQYPVKEKKLKKVEEKYYALIIEKNHQIGMVKRPEEGLLANLWGVPMIEEKLWKEGSFEKLEYVHFNSVNHVFTHKKWLMEPIAIKWSETLESYLRRIHYQVDEINYFDEEELKQIPIATAFKKVLKSVQIKLK